MKTKYPVYVISKGRAECCHTADFMIRDGLDFKLVIEPQEKEAYLKKYPEELLAILPFSNLGKGSIPARNWVWQNSIDRGFERHWIFDDNIMKIYRRYKGYRLPCNSIQAIQACETFTDRYENIGISGMNYSMFVPDRHKRAPFFLNNHVYSCLCIDNKMKYRWRGRYNEDTDLCLQVLSGGLCTVLFNVFVIDKIATLTMKGGNATELYKGDGRLKMARSLEQAWPYVARTDRRFRRPQHKIRDEWKKFDTPLIKKKDVAKMNFDKVDNFGLKLKAVKEVRSTFLKGLVEDN